MANRIHNVRLLNRLRRAQAAQTQSPCPAEPAPPSLQLLGRGLDAVICKSRLPEETWIYRLLNPKGITNELHAPTPAERLARYRDALQMFTDQDLFADGVRMVRGAEVQHQVRVHRRAAAQPPSNVIPFLPLRARRV